MATLRRALAVARGRARTALGLDLRSLALVRISLAVTLLWVTYANGTELRAFYTDVGVLPRWLLVDHPIGFLGFSLYMAGGQVPYIATLFLLQAAFGIAMLLGYRTTLTTVGSYVMLLSMQNREPVLQFGADIVLRVALFWAIFLPLGARMSLDAAAGRARSRRDPFYIGLPGVAFILQVAAIYVVGSLVKNGPTWTTEHTAVYYALSLDVYSRPFGQWLNQFDGVTRALTVLTIYVERYGPLLLVFPLGTTWTRITGILLLASLQIGFGLCMTMGAFGPLMVGLTLAFVPSGVWDSVATWWRAGGTNDAGASQPERPARHMPVVGRRAFAARLTRDGVVAVLVVVMLLWNIGNVPGQRWRLTPGLVRLANTVGLNQSWNMFAPDPQTYDGWFVVVGTERDGTQVNLVTHADSVSFEKPAWVPGSYHTDIWMAYLISFWFPGTSFPNQYARYLGETWNQTHTGSAQLRSVEINSMRYNTGPDHTKSDLERVTLWTQYF